MKREDIDTILAKGTPWQDRVNLLYKELEATLEIGAPLVPTAVLAEGLGDIELSKFLTRYGPFEPLRKFTAPGEDFVNHRKVRCVRWLWGHPDEAREMCRLSESRRPEAFALYTARCQKADAKANALPDPSTPDKPPSLEQRVAALEEQVKALMARTSGME